MLMMIDANLFHLEMWYLLGKKKLTINAFTEKTLFLSSLYFSGAARPALSSKLLSDLKFGDVDGPNLCRVKK